MFAPRQQNWTAEAPKCWENTSQPQLKHDSICVLVLSAPSFGCDTERRNPAGYSLNTSIIPVAINPICMERCHGLQRLFQANLAHCWKVVLWNSHKASLKMPATPTEKNRGVNPKQATRNWSFSLSFSSPSIDTGEPAGRLRFFGSKSSGLPVARLPTFVETNRHPLRRRRRRELWPEETAFSWQWWCFIAI